MIQTKCLENEEILKTKEGPIIRLAYYRPTVYDIRVIFPAAINSQQSANIVGC